MTETSMMQVQSVLESQVKRQYKYADYSDTSLCERELMRMLQLLRHLFYHSGSLLIPHISDKRSNKALSQSQISTHNLSQMKKVSSSESNSNRPLGERVIGLWTQIIEELGSNSQEKYSDIINETFQCATTFASQNARFKNHFAALQGGNQSKKQSLLKIFTDKVMR